MGREERGRILEELDKDFEGVMSVVVADYRGIDAQNAVLLRRKFKDSSVKYVISKNTLAKISAQRKGIEGLGQYLSGPSALALSKDDPVAPSKVIKEFLKEHPGVLKIKGGYVEGSLMDAKQVESLASIPPRNVLLSKLVGSIQSPLVGFVSVLGGPVRNLLGVLNAIKDKKANE